VSLSIRVTSADFDSSQAAERPEMPEPITATRMDVFFSLLGWVQAGTKDRSN
jgi:hypothetical protein